MLSGRIYSEWMAETQRAKLGQIIDKVRPSGRILDVGCGPGFLEEIVPGAVATDIDLENLRRANGLKVLASGDTLPFKTNIFDFVFCIDTIHLLKGTSELARVLNENGRLAVSIFCNPENCQEKMEELKKRFQKMKVMEEFFAETQREWDAVLVVKR